MVLGLFSLKLQQRELLVKEIVLGVLCRFAQTGMGFRPNSIHGKGVRRWAEEDVESHLMSVTDADG